MTDSDSAEELAKLIALRAFYDGQRARDGDYTLTDVARMAERRLAEMDATKENLRRRLFYLIVLAEACRFDRSAVYRNVAMSVHNNLSVSGENISPYPWYMTIVDATTCSPNSGNFGDITVAGSRTDEVDNPVRWEITAEGLEAPVSDVACDALGLSFRDITARPETIETPLAELSRLHLGSAS